MKPKPFPLASSPACPHRALEPLELCSMHTDVCDSIGHRDASTSRLGHAQDSFSLYHRCVLDVMAGKRRERPVFRTTGPNGTRPSATSRHPRLQTCLSCLQSPRLEGMHTGKLNCPEALPPKPSFTTLHFSLALADTPPLLSHRQVSVIGTGRATN